MPHRPKPIGCLVRVLLFAVALPSSMWAAEPGVSGLKASHRHGQTFITWKDAAEGAAGAKYRYSVYRDDQPITAANLGQAQLVMTGVLHNSAKLFGSAFNAADRLDPTKPYSVIIEGGQPLPAWSGLAVITAAKAGSSFYAVVATEDEKPVGDVVPGESATTDPVEETPAPIQPIKLYDSKDRGGPYVRLTSITGQRGLPLHVSLGGSDSRGGGAGEYGDYYLYFGTPQMGFRDGMPGVFSVAESHSKDGNRLTIRTRDGMEHPALRNMESYWFGYACVPQWATHPEPRFYPFTENRLLWIVRWVAERYGADPQRITMGGNSSGAVGSNNVGFRHPEMFAAVFPTVGRVRNVPAVWLDGRPPKGTPVMMADGTTDYLDRANGPKFAAEHHADLPFIGWACGRNDGYATVAEHLDLIKALTANHHGFAFSWNNGNHGGDGAAFQAIQKYYPANKFALDRSYPAFGNSSLNDNLGSGDPADGDLEGGINLGFDWRDVDDQQQGWAATISNDLAKGEMKVDVTPRRSQRFKPKPGTKLHWSTAAGAAGAITADEHGLATIPQLPLPAGEGTRVTISASPQ